MRKNIEERTFKRAGSIFATLGLDLKGGTHLVYEAEPKKDSELTADDMEGARKILEKRVNSFGISESSVQLVGSGTGVPTKILVQLPGLQQINVSITIAGQVKEKELEDIISNLGYETRNVLLRQKTFKHSPRASEQRFHIVYMPGLRKQKTQNFPKKQRSNIIFGR